MQQFILLHFSKLFAVISYHVFVVPIRHQPYRINIYKPYKFSCLVTKLCGLLLECVANNFVSITHQELGVRYAAVHLPASGQAVVLVCMGKTWKTQMVIHNGRRWFLNGGWAKFARDNGLRVGDICLFDLKKNARNLTMKVHIISREQFSLK